MEEEAVLSGDNAFNAHFGECIAAIGDIDDDGYQGQPKQFTLCLLVFARGGDFSNALHWMSSTRRCWKFKPSSGLSRDSRCTFDGSTSPQVTTCLDA